MHKSIGELAYLAYAAYYKSEVPFSTLSEDEQKAWHCASRTVFDITFDVFQEAIKNAKE